MLTVALPSGKQEKVIFSSKCAFLPPFGTVLQHFGAEMLQSGISVLARVLREHNKSDKKLKKVKNFVKKNDLFSPGS